VAAEQRENPRYARFNALESLERTLAKVLLIYSGDDRTVLKKEHYDPLYEKFRDAAHVKFLLLQGKNHNPTFENESVKYKNEFFARYQKALKKGALATAEAQADFMGSFDWWFMTNQDMTVWSAVFAHLNS
jgi:chaperone required for assembly of F1-ATPase